MGKLGHSRPRNERYVPDCPKAHGRDRCWMDAINVVGNDPRRTKPSDRRRMAAADHMSERES